MAPNSYLTILLPAGESRPVKYVQRHMTTSRSELYILALLLIFVAHSERGYPDQVKGAWRQDLARAPWHETQRSERF
jgi:hypothetical protein